MFRRLQSLLRDYFGFSHNESRGFLLVLLLALLALLLPFLYRYVAQSQPTDTTVTDQRRLDSLLTLMQTEDARAQKFGNRAADENDKTTFERFSDPKLFRFDPNTLNVAGWQQLGVPAWLARRIDNYRSKGGKFRRKEDLLRIYDFPPDLYEQLEPYITLAPNVAKDRPATYAGDQPRDNTPASSPRSDHTDYVARPTRPAPQPFDINQADTSQLIALKGIGTTLASRIIKFRDALGGFVSTDQFRDVYGLDSLALSELMRFAQIRSGVRKIPINRATAEELDRLPFVSRRQAQVIVSYREQHGAYTSAESLRPIRVLDPQTIEKMTPYLEF